MSAWRPARLALSAALLAAALDALVRMGDGPLAPPPLSISGTVSWSNRTTAVVAAFALVRLVALALGGYLLALAVLGGAVHTMRTRRGIALLDRATLPALRRARDDGSRHARHRHRPGHICDTQPTGLEHGPDPTSRAFDGDHSARTGRINTAVRPGCATALVVHG